MRNRGPQLRDRRLRPTVTAAATVPNRPLKQVLLWDDLPRSKVGKVLKTEIRARL